MATEINTANNINNMEELKKLLSANGYNIKELAQLAQELNNKPEENKQEAAKKKISAPKKAISWELGLALYPDFVIRRTTAQTERDLVVMPSKSTMFIRDVKTGSTEALTVDSYVNFTASMPNIAMPEDFWLSEVKSGKLFFEKLTRVMSTPICIEMIKHRCITKFEHLFDPYRSTSTVFASDTNACIENYQKFPILYAELWQDDRSRDTFCKGRNHFVEVLIDNFGIQNARDFLQSWTISLFGTDSYTRGYRSNAFSMVYHDRRLTNNNNRNSTSCIPPILMDYKSFKEYVLYDSVHMGYGLNPHDFFVQWSDVLTMQMSIYGKIKDKYPKDLPTLHQQLAYKQTLMREKINEMMFAQQVERTKKYEMVVDDYIFLAPKAKEDFYDEATQQANCLASYVNRYTQGDCHIIFMRKKNAPEVSVVTIELRADTVCQKYQAHNAACTAEQNAVIAQWLKKVVEINHSED